MERYRISDFRRYVLLSTVIGILNLFTFSNYYSSLVIVFAEAIILFVLLLGRKYDEFYALFLIFLCMSFEFNSTTGSNALYGFKAFEIGGINISFLFLIVFLVFYIVSKRDLQFERKSEDGQFVYAIFVLGVFGVTNGMITLLLNDNNVNRFQNVESLFLGQVYLKFVMELVFAFVTYLILRHKDRSVEKLKMCLVAILIGAIMTMIVSRITSNMGFYGGVSTLQIQNVVRYIPFLYIYSLMEKKRSIKLITFILATVGTIFTLLYNATGKMIIMYAIIPVVVLIVSFKADKKLALLELIALPIGGLIFMNYLMDDLNESVMFSSKLREVAALFSFNKGWLSKMPESPRARIAELIDVLYEYSEHPIRIFLGKGYLGTVKDYMGMITNIKDGYTSAENSLGAYYGMHESINNLFLINGIMGIAFLVKFFKKLLGSLLKTMNAYSALFWLVFAYGFSFTLTGYGITALMICLFESSKSTKENDII